MSPSESVFWPRACAWVVALTSLGLPSAGQSLDSNGTDLELTYLVQATGIDVAAIPAETIGSDALDVENPWIVLCAGDPCAASLTGWSRHPEGVIGPIPDELVEVIAESLGIPELLARSSGRLLVLVPWAEGGARAVDSRAGSVEPAVRFIDEARGLDPELIAVLAGVSFETGVRVGYARGLAEELSVERWIAAPGGFARLVEPELAREFAVAVGSDEPVLEPGEEVVYWMPLDVSAVLLVAPGDDDDPLHMPAVAPPEAAPGDEEEVRPPADGEVVECGSFVRPEEVPLALAQEASGAYDVPPGQLVATYYIPMTFHVVRSSAHTGGLSATRLAAGLTQVNSEFAEMQFCFYQQGPTLYIDDDRYYIAVDNVAEADALRRIEPVADTVNVYFVPNFVPYAGLSSFTFSDPQGIVIDNDYVGLAGTTTFPHEVGHLFDLYHTHETALGRECVKRTGTGVNCTTAGDLLCDTPADPGLGTANVNTSCVYTGTTNGPCTGDGRYAPNPRNLMSYSRSSCRNDFSSGQVARARSTLVTLRPEWANLSLPVPGLNVASNGTYCDRVALSWNAAGGTASYRIYRSTTNTACPGTPLTTVTTTTYDDRTATPGVHYYYSLRVVGACGTGPCGPTNVGWRASAPPAPTGLTASDGTVCGGVQLNWASVSGATAYKVYRSATNTACGGSPIATVSGNSHLDATASGGINYYYSVRAVGTCGDGACSTTDRGTRPRTSLGAPSGVSASDNTYCDRIRISWTAVSGATSYRIFRNTSNTPPAPSATPLGTDDASPWNDYTAVPGTRYYYWVRAANACATSANSASNYGTRGTTGTVGRPTGVSATDGTLTTGVNLAWTAVATAEDYLVFRAPGDTAPTTPLATDAGSPYLDTSAVPGLTYYYWVRARNSCATSALSLPNTGWRALSPPAVSASIAPGAPAIVVTWTPTLGASHYQVYRATSSAGVKSAVTPWQSAIGFVDTSASPGRYYYYWVRAATNSSGLRASALSTPPAQGRR